MEPCWWRRQALNLTGFVDEVKDLVHNSEIVIERYKVDDA